MKKFTPKKFKFGYFFILGVVPDSDFWGDVWQNFELFHTTKMNDDQALTSPNKGLKKS